jgi:hypothetical protein
MEKLMKIFRAESLLKRNTPLLTFVSAVFVLTFGEAVTLCASAASFTPGDLVVSTYGNTGTLAQGAPSPISLIEYSTAGGSPILTDTLPTTNGVGGANNLGIVGQYGSNSEGNIQLSANGLYLTLAGYSATAAAAGIDASTNTANGTKFTAGTAFNSSTVSLAQSTDTNVPRLAVLVDGNGKVNSSTELNDVYSTNNPRSVYSANGSTFYISGQGDGNTGDQGTFYGPIGLNTVTSQGSSPADIYNSVQTRYVTAFNGNLYQSIDTSSGSSTGIWKFNGLPTNSAGPTRIIPGNNGKTGSSEVFYSPEGFFFANANTLYVADTGSPKAGSKADGGIQKWTLSGSTWSLQYTLMATALFNNDETGFEAITGMTVGTGATATVKLFAVSYTSDDDQPDGLYSITDTLAATSGTGETFTKLESSPGNGGANFKGVSFAPSLPGDFNRDGHVNAADIVAMEQALSNLPAYESAQGLNDSQLLGIADINGDGIVNNADIQSLVNLLKSGGGSAAAVPEPPSLVLMLLAIPAFLCLKRFQ